MIAGRFPATICLAFVTAACGGTLDAGRDTPQYLLHDASLDAQPVSDAGDATADQLAPDAGLDAALGLLPVGEHNPVILMNDDWSGDWLGEYAALLANTGGPPVVGIVVKKSSIWGDLSINASGWEDLVVAARSSGLAGIPDVTASVGDPLIRPGDGQIESTVANRSTGAQLIIDASRQSGSSTLPVVIAAATELTDVADAYLMDPTVVDRVVVVASLGSYVAPDGFMGSVNGDMDPWADWIVAQRFRYIQVNAWYDQMADVTDADLANLPANPLGDRFRNKLPNLIAPPAAADQVAVLATGLPMFTLAVQRVSPDTSAAFDSTQGPRLIPDAAGNGWIVTQVSESLPRSRLWQMLLDPSTFGN